MRRHRHRSGTIALLVDHGRVNCPRQLGDIDIEDCYGCPGLVDIETRDEETYFVCRPSAVMSQPFTGYFTGVGV
jgi:hypothetical protein